MSMNRATQQAAAEATGDLSPLRESVQACIQCGTCTGSCPNAFAMDYTPRQLWRLLLVGAAQEIFSTKTFILCSACYLCTLRCPRGLPLTDLMAGLKAEAARRGMGRYRASILFYDSFLANVRRNGRVREMGLMMRYFARLGRPGPPLANTGLGLKLMAKGKLRPAWPRMGGAKLAGLFHRVAALEAAGQGEEA
jgi:heterodisulfide reductase subunit C